jgi:hypothetical protein
MAFGEGGAGLPTDGSTVKQIGLLDTLTNFFYHPQRDPANGGLKTSISNPGQLAGVPYKQFTEFTRATGATPYDPQDVISTSGGYLVPFTNIALANGGKGVIGTAICVQKSFTVVTPQLYMVLFGGNAAPTAIADNGQAAFTHAEMNNLIDVIPLTQRQIVYNGGAAGAASGSGVIVHSSGAIAVEYECGSTSTTIWMALCTDVAFIPVASTIFRPGLGARVFT